MTLLPIAIDAMGGDKAPGDIVAGARQAAEELGVPITLVGPPEQVGDTGGLDGFGLILEHPQAAIARFAEEHGFLDLSACNDRPKVGDVVRIVPNHVCACVNLHDRLVAVRGDEIVGEWAIAARGTVR